MKKVMTKILSVVLTVVMLLSIAPLCELSIKANAAYIVESGSCGKNVVYKLDSDGLLTISGSGEMYGMENFRDNMFSGDCTPWDKDEVKRVVIENGVTSIGEYAFSDHYELCDIQIADSVVSIGEGAFQYCSALISLILPKKLTYIPSSMCSLADLRYVYIPATVAKIGYAAFYYNDIIEVEFGGTQSQWNKVAIDYYNESITEAYMVYNGSNALSSAKYGKCGDNVTWNLTTDGTLRISGNGHMDSYAEGAVVGKYFEQFAGGTDHPWFKYRSKVKKIIIDSGVLSVGAYSFFDCFNCKSVEIKNGVKTIKDGAFACIPISSVSLPNSVSTLGKYVFESCGALRQVTFSDNITVLDDEAFQYCYNLETPVLPKNLTRINYSVFYNCEFDEVTIPETVTYIGDNFAFVDTVRFLGALPSFGLSGPPDYLLRADYWYCKPEYYEAYKATFTKWRATGSLSDGQICAKLNKTSVILDPSDVNCQLTVSDETGTATSLTKKWWVEKSEIASVNQNGVVTASGHGKTMLYVEISANGHRSLAGCEVATKRNDLMVALLPKNIEADFPVTCGTRSTHFGEVDFTSYLPGKLAEEDTSNQYYQQLLSLTNSLIVGCSTDKQKAKAIFNWVSNNITYGGAIGIGNTAGQAYAVYVNRKAHCEGFAKLTGFMLYLADIPSCLVASAGHMWNIALLDGEWTMVDSTNKKFGTDYNDCSTIEWIGFGVDDLCFVIDNTEGIKLAGVGNRYLSEEREKYTSIVVPDFVDIIFGNAFGLCSNLKSVTIPKSVKKIKVDAFDDCEKLTKVTYMGSEGQWNAVQIEDGNDSLIDANKTFATVLKSIAVKTMPTKTAYFLGENFDPSGLTLTATYSDGTTETIVSGYTISGFSSTSVGEKTVSVSYQGKTKTFKVTIIKEKNTVNYYANGGSVSPASVSVVYGGSTTLPTPVRTVWITYSANGGSNGPSAQNCNLNCDGWSTSSSATTAQYSCGSTYKPVKDITLYAVWQKANLTLSSSVPTRSGYKFLGWSSDKYATTASYAPGERINVSDDVTLYAVWKKIVYTINYYPNGGTVNPSTEDIDAGASTKLPTPTKSVQITFDANGGTRTPDAQTCYLNCAGWATNSSSTTGEYACGSTYKPTGHATLYAVWQKTTVNLISGKPMKEGYKFLGWSRDANATTATYKAGGKINVSGNVTLYAVWGEYEEGDKIIEAVQTNDIALNYKSTAVIPVEVTGTDNYTVEYESSAPGVVTVDENGNIITNGTGDAEITVTVTDEFGNVAEDTCTVTVSYAWWQWIIVIVLFGWIWY